jgi:polysaccharide deacetylase family protein (PEP-CTERM system associated)
MRRRHWDAFESRIVANVTRLLDVLNQHGTRATFFVLGWVAERHPQLIRDIMACGHEIASHGYNHEFVTAQTPALFREDARKAKILLEDLTGRAIRGYRAPGFTITAETPWALPILIEEGYTYDSSILPIRHSAYGIPGSDPWCHIRETPAGYIWEVPPTTARWGRLRWPIGGGSYFRLLPFALIEHLLHGIDRDGHELVLYFHVWEFDSRQPRMDGPLLSQLQHYLNLHQTEKRLVSLLGQFTLGTIQDYLDVTRTNPINPSIRFTPTAEPVILTDPV